MIAVGLTLLSILLNVGSLVVIGEYPYSIMLLLIFSSITNYFFFSKAKINHNLGIIFFFTYLQLSFVCPAIFHKLLVIPIEASNFYFLGMKIGIGLHILITISLLTSEKFLQPHNNFIRIPPLKKLEFSESLIIIGFLGTALCLTFLSYKLGISRMGVPAPELPFKLEPFLNITRNTLIPAFFVFTWLKIEGSKTKILLLLGFALWALAEVSLRGSRSAFIYALTPFVIFLIYSGYFQGKRFTLLLITSLIALILNFAIGTAVRERFSSPDTPLLVNLSIEQALSGAYRRLFPDVELMRKFHSHLPPYTMTNLTLYSQHDGGVNYHTYIIDRNPVGTAHSSGITGLTDGYLFASLPGLSICALFLLSLFFLNDLKLRGRPEFQATILPYLIHITIWADGSISYFFYRSPLTILALPIGVLFYSYFLGHLRLNKHQSPLSASV